MSVRLRVMHAVAGISFTLLGCALLLRGMPDALGAWRGQWSLVHPVEVYGTLALAIISLALATWFLFSLYRSNDTL